MAFLGTTLSTARYMLQPAVAQLFSRAQPVVCHKPYTFELFNNFVDDALILAAFGKTMRLATRHEIDGRLWSKIATRVEHWIEKNKPRQHNKYRPIPQIKTRRPSVMQ